MTRCKTEARFLLSTPGELVSSAPASATDFFFLPFFAMRSCFTESWVSTRSGGAVRLKWRRATYIALVGVMSSHTGSCGTTLPCSQVGSSSATTGVLSTSFVLVTFLQCSVSKLTAPSRKWKLVISRRISLDKFSPRVVTTSELKEDKFEFIKTKRRDQ